MDALPETRDPDIAALSDALLARPDLAPPLPRRQPPGRDWGRWPVSLFIGFHLLAVLTYNLPSTGVARGPRVILDRLFQVRHYIWATGNDQSWRMFAPAPPGANRYLRVLVHDDQGRVTDLEQDVYGRQTFPYLFHERRRKVNSNFVNHERRRPAYGAWACRRWELDHGGRPAREAELVWLSTPIPAPGSPERRFGFDPRRLPLTEKTVARVDCRTQVHAQLPPRVRRRLGLPEAGVAAFRPLRQITWANRERLFVRPGSAAPP